MAIRNRRVVTGLNSDGRSCVLFDGGMDKLANDHPNIALAWRTDRVPGCNRGRDERSGISLNLERLSDGGSYFLLFEIGKFDTPVMHVTDTIDYAVVLRGEFLLQLETQRMILKPGDLLIDRGVNHGWSAVGEAPVLMAAVMLPARPLTGLPRTDEMREDARPPSGTGTHLRNRRVVTGLNAQGRSCILFDSGMDSLPLVHARKALAWRTGSMPADNGGMADTCHGDIGPDGGSAFLLFEIGTDEVHEPCATDTIDYGVVLRGKVQLHLETEVVLLEPGDLIVIRGVIHGWSAVGGEAALIAMVLVSAHPLEARPSATATPLHQIIS